MKFSELLEQKGTTVTQLSKDSGVGTQTIRDLVNEGAQIKNVRMGTAKKMADVLKITLDELYNTIEQDIIPKSKDRTIEELKKILDNKEELIIKTDWEYSLLIGQLAHYMQKNTANARETQKYINIFLDCKSQEHINNAIIERYRQAKIDSKIFENVLSKVLIYEVEKIEYGAIVAGYLGENILWYSREKNSDKSKKTEGEKA